MMKKGNSKRSKKVSPTDLPFHKRFAIDLGLEDAKRMFVNRIRNFIFDDFFENALDEEIYKSQVIWNIANDLGEEYEWYHNAEHYTSDFISCLQVLESSYKALTNASHRAQLSGLISHVIKLSEVDLGITWNDGVFRLMGAPLLDAVLVNDNLTWLAEPRYHNVYAPFEKGLSHYLRMQKDPRLAYDVITDMYESLEALAKIFTDRPTGDLSSNVELFLSKLNLSSDYRGLFKAYILFANNFRHGLEARKKRPDISSREIESFIYLTGLFIRLAIGTTSSSLPGRSVQ